MCKYLMYVRQFSRRIGGFAPKYLILVNRNYLRRMILSPGTYTTTDKIIEYRISSAKPGVFTILIRFFFVFGGI